MNIYRDILNVINDGKRAVLIKTLNNSGEDNKFSHSEFFLTEDDLREGNKKNLDENIYSNALVAIETGNLKFTHDAEKGTTVVEPYFPEPRLVILGGGHISKPLVEFASKVGFNITVVDDRPFFANKERFPGANRVICESFEKSFKLLNLNSSSFVVIITRGHRHDMICLKEALKCNTAYVGMIGSKRRIKIVKEEALSEGYSQEALERLNAPIGLPIDAVTPEEIAISILAQIISYKRGKSVVSGSLGTYKVSYPDFEPAVVEELAKETDEPRAVVTIVSTKGSVPRKAGAKMIVYADGRILGSIGGGCSEGEVIITARDIIRNGGYALQTVDMTADQVEEEGMVCGGIMEVIIEKL